MKPMSAPLKELDQVEVLTLIDNFIDVLLEDNGVVTRPPRPAMEEIPTETLLAEHGLSLLVRVQSGAEESTPFYLIRVITAWAFYTIWKNWPWTPMSWKPLF